MLVLSDNSFEIMARVVATLSDLLALRFFKVQWNSVLHK